MKIKLLLIIALLGFTYTSKTFAQQDNKNYLSTESINLNTYPNPVTNKLTVRFSLTMKQQVHRLEIVNIIGKKIREQQILDKNTTEISFNDLEDIPQGIYLIIAKDEYGKIIQSNKFIVSK